MEACPLLTWVGHTRVGVQGLACQLFTQKAQRSALEVPTYSPILIFPGMGLASRSHLGLPGPI